MRKQAFIPATVVAVMLAASLSGCAAPAPQQESGAASPAAQESATAPAPVVSDSASPEEILNAISADFEATEKSIADNLASTKTAAGDSYDTYVANKGAITDWIDSTQTATDELFARTDDNSKRYFHALAKQAQSDEKADLDKQMKAWYRAVY